MQVVYYKQVGMHLVSRLLHIAMIILSLTQQYNVQISHINMQKTQNFTIFHVPVILKNQN